MRPSRTAPARKIEPATQTVSAELERALDRARSGSGFDRRPCAAPSARRDAGGEILGRQRPRRRRRVATTAETCGSSAREDGVDVLVAHHADDQRRPLRVPARAGTRPAPARRRRCARRRAARCRPPAERAAARAAPASRRSARPCSMASVGHARCRRRGGGLEQPDGDQRVADLMLAAQRQRHRPVGGAAASRRVMRARPSTIADVDARVRAPPRSAARRARPRPRATTASASAGRSPATTGMPGLMMPAFSKAIVAERVAEMLLVIEADRRDGAGHRSDDVGGVEPAAEADLDHRDLDAGAAEQLERRSPSSPRRTSACTASAPLACSRSAQSSTSSRRRRAAAGVDRRVVDDEPLGQVD